LSKLLIIAVVTIATMIAIAAAAVFVSNPQDNKIIESLTPTPSMSLAPTATPIIAGSHGPTPTASPKTNESAAITFSVPIQIFSDEHTFKDTNETLYEAIAYIAWAPSPYVRYYEVTPNYHGNTKPYQNLWLGSDFRTWASRAAELHPLGWAEKETWILAETDPHVSDGTWMRTFTASGTWIEVVDGVKINGPAVWSSDMHGLQVVSVRTTFSQNENLSRDQMGAVGLELKQWLIDYTQGWTYTIKNVS
jgi:hypothetical protein